MLSTNTTSTKSSTVFIPDLESLAMAQIPVIRYIPKNLKTDFAKILNQTISDLIYHKDTEHWVLFLALPKLLLWAPKRRKQIFSLLPERFSKWKDKQFHDLYNDAMTNKIANNKDTNPKNQAINLALKNNLSGACSVLSGYKPASNSTEAYEILKKKHPEEDHFNIQPTNEKIEIQNYLVLKCIKSFRKGSGGGPFGLLPEHLMAATEVVIHADILKNITALVNMIVNGEIPDQIKPLLMGASLSALEKPNQDLRPIAVGNTIRRLAAKCLADVVNKELREVFQPVQFAIGTPSGAEQIIHSVRNSISNIPTAQKNLAILKIDIHNAFNEVLRKRIIEQHKKYAQRSVPYMAAAYGSPSKLFFGDKVILSCRGVQQGDPMAMTAFCLSTIDIIKGLDKFQVSSFWFADEGTIIGSLEILINPFNTLSKN